MFCLKVIESLKGITRRAGSTLPLGHSYTSHQTSLSLFLNHEVVVLGSKYNKFAIAVFCNSHWTRSLPTSSLNAGDNPGYGGFTPPESETHG